MQGRLLQHMPWVFRLFWKLFRQLQRLFRFLPGKLPKQLFGQLHWHCTNSCTSCTGTCTGGCQTNCTGQCDNACTGENQAELIAHLGDNIGIGKIIMASDYTEIKNAMENEYRRRGMELPQPFEKQPIPGEPVILSITKEVLTDIYEFDKAPEHDWRELFSKWELAAAPKWAPVLSHIKTLMTSIAVNVNAVSEE